MPAFEVDRPVIRKEHDGPLRVGLRRPTSRIRRWKAGVEGSMPVSCYSPTSHLDPEPTSAALNSPPRSGRSDPSRGPRRRSRGSGHTQVGGTLSD